MIRKFLTFDGEILEETEWNLKPVDKCFYCDEFLINSHRYCTESQDGNHDWITLVKPSKTGGF